MYFGQYAKPRPKWSKVYQIDQIGSNWIKLYQMGQIGSNWIKLDQIVIP